MSYWKKAWLMMPVLALAIANTANVQVARAYSTSFVYEAETMPTAVGYTQHYSGTPGYSAMKADTVRSAEGYMVYGPYATDQLQGKRYRVTWKMKTGSDNVAPVAKIDINDVGFGVIFHQDIYANDFNGIDTYTDFSTDFTKRDTNPMEYRVWFYDKSDLEVDKITVEEIEPTDSITYESETQRRNIGQRIVDPTASAGKAVKALASEGSEFMQFGPYTVDQEINNTFKATFRLKVNNNSSSSPVVRIDAANSWGGGEWSWKKIKGADFTATDTWQDFSIVFNRANEGTMEYRILSYGATDITADYVKVEKVTQNTNTYESEDLFSSVGTVVTDMDASGGQARMADYSTVGDLQYGPYGVDQASGSNYRATFRMSVSNNTLATPVARIEALNSGGNSDWRYKIIRANDFAASNRFEDFSVDFTRTDKGTMEYKVYSFGNSDGISFKVDKVDVYKINTSDWTYESESSFGSVGKVVLDPTASNSKAREATVSTDAPGYVVYGPYSDDQPINNVYTATFKLKTRNNSLSSGVAKIEVFNSGGTSVWVYKDIKGSDFSANNTWQDFNLNFSRQPGGNLEFRVWFYDTADITVDKVTVTPFGIDPVIYQAENMSVKSGVASIINDANAEGSKAVKALANNTACDIIPGFCYMVYGPYTVDQAPGNYEVTFRVKRGSTITGETLATVDAVNNGGSGVYVSKDLNMTNLGTDYTDVKLNFYRTGEGTMEYRVYFNNKTDITVDKITVKKI